MKMNIILSGNHYMMVVNKIYEDYFTCNVLSCNGNVKLKVCIYPSGRADLYEFNGVDYGVTDVDVSVLYCFVKDKISSKTLEQYIDECFKNWQDANDEYFHLEQESIINPKPNVDYEKLIDEVEYNLLLKNFSYASPKKYKKISEKVTYLTMYDNIIATKDMLMKSECKDFTKMIHLCDEKLLEVKEKLSNLENE